MCSFLECPIYDQCEHEIDQVLYCRQIAMMKRIAETRRKLIAEGKIVKPKQQHIPVLLKAPFSEPQQSDH